MGKSTRRKPNVRKNKPGEPSRPPVVGAVSPAANRSENFFREQLNPSPAAGDGKKAASITVISVRDIHITEIDVNGTALLKDKDAGKDEKITGTGTVFPSRPVSLYLHCTGLPNTQVTVELDIDAVKEYSEALYIPQSGNLVLQKNIT